MAGFNQSCFLGLGLGVYYIAGLNAGQGLNVQADPIKKKLINKTQELPLALNISICSNLINLAMAHTDCQWSWPNPQNESQSPSLYLKKWQAVLKPRRFLWMVWWRGPPAQSTQISCWSLTDWPSGVYCLVGWLAQVHPVLSDQQMSKSQINEKLDQVHLFCLSVCKMDLKAASSLVHPGNGGGVVCGWMKQIPGWNGWNMIIRIYNEWDSTVTITFCQRSDIGGIVQWSISVRLIRW